MKKRMMAVAFSLGLVSIPGAFAVGNTEARMAELLKKCERASTPRTCACVPKEMKNAGFSDDEILMYSNRAYKAVTPEEKARYMEYGMKLRMVVAPMCSVK
ncbi:MAG: hypothetical protein KJ989_07105 [Gammaproteobacteria bacterium]|uniref:hypothetical protein n=1 Tax=Pseudomonas sp. Ga0074129 TaxID=1752219 RepID=UPI000A7D7CB2|nr:hypothetical protein [Pseudomonas sp. Ga0074129]MBU1285575.1 hypothetical protein [Gammaproteobacteria bacterium]MBU2157535.1 hypothetical protein [Gammaproteobacteria bacterium]MBU2253385.1 hypothetical protein [Gammaproteobacteria bacterium]MBU2293957.1 hypothetical protein [Gammaproteobacteria bacterium]